MLEYSFNLSYKKILCCKKTEIYNELKQEFLDCLKNKNGLKALNEKLDRILSEEDHNLVKTLPDKIFFENDQ